MNMTTDDLAKRVEAIAARQQFMENGLLQLLSEWLDALKVVMEDYEKRIEALEAVGEDNEHVRRNRPVCSPKI